MGNNYHRAMSFGYGYGRPATYGYGNTKAAMETQQAAIEAEQQRHEEMYKEARAKAVKQGPSHLPGMGLCHNHAGYHGGFSRTGYPGQAEYGPGCPGFARQHGANANQGGGMYYSGPGWAESNGTGQPGPRF